MKSVVLSSLAVVAFTLASSNDALAQQYPFSCDTSGECASVTNSGTGLGLYAQTSSTTGSAVFARNQDGPGITVWSGSDYGIASTCLNGIAVYGSSITGNGVLGTSEDYNGVQGNAMMGGTSGVYGEFDGNTAVSGPGYGVAGRIVPSGSGDAVYGDNNSSLGYAGYFHGNVFVSGTLTQNSDLRLKTHVAPLAGAGAMDQLLQLRGVTFEWKDPSAHASMTGVQRGFIAQEVEKVFPNWVGVDSDGYKTVDYRGLEALEVESLRTLKTENDALRAKTANLEDRLKALEANRPPMRSGFSDGLAGFGLVVAASALLLSRRKRAAATI